MKVIRPTGSTHYKLKKLHEPTEEVPVLPLMKYLIELELTTIGTNYGYSLKMSKMDISLGLHGNVMKTYGK